ncbi:MAG: secreted glycosyl hydrolase, partial [Sphingomonadales bacterium 39-62-4]
MAEGRKAVMMAKLMTSTIGAALLLAASGASAAAPVTDCANRDTPFSAASPLVDVLLSEQARAVVEKAIPGKIAAMPPMFTGTTPPTFAAILDVKSAAGFFGTDAAKIAEIDAALRKVPVTDADRVARCARFDNEVPALTPTPGKPNILVFEKINGFKDTPSVDAAHAALIAMAARKGWALSFTDKGGAFNPQTLGQFDVVLWNNISGDVLTVSQRAAFKDWLEAGGAFVGMHGSAGDPVYFWDWYPDTL